MKHPIYCKIVLKNCVCLCNWENSLVGQRHKDLNFKTNSNVPTDCRWLNTFM